ncbi:MAG: right-handed parallel beta-helix repeat-containing protein [Candidatus Schekmanbacteria bacterium]|nr:right-handed parallel beta-helix repeat-containing protein [Candidatus Schekmanbacteria bacterium]
MGNVKRLRTRLLWLTTGVFLFISPASAVERYANGSCAVDGDGSLATCTDTPGGTGAVKTVQTAINIAADGDIVKIVPYAAYSIAKRLTITAYYENLFIAKPITLDLYTGNLQARHLPPASSRLLNFWVVIDGDQNGDQVGDNGDHTITWNGGVSGTIQNLTLSGGFSRPGADPGAGIMVGGKNTRVLLKDLNVTNNETGIAVRYGAAPTIVGCTVMLNMKTGIAVMDASSPVIGGGNDYNSPLANSIVNNSWGMFESQCLPRLAISDCEKEKSTGCAAVSVLDGSTPQIWGNQIISNKFVGLVSTQQSAPSIKWNLIQYNGQTGIGLFSTGQEMEIAGNRIEDNDLGIGIQSSGNPCDKIKIKDNDILHNNTGGIISCNSYLQIGGEPGEGNRIYDNEGGRGIFLASQSEALISNNSIINNGYSGVRLFVSKAGIEQNLIAANGCVLAENNKCYSQASQEFGQIELDAGIAENISHNLIVGGNYANGAFEGVGILAGETGVYEYTPSVLEDVKNNIIYRVGLGIKLMSNAGYNTVKLYRPGAVDRNLVMHWGNSGLDTDGTLDGYLLGADNAPGDNTFYFGQNSGSGGFPPQYFFSDPDHETSAYNAGAFIPDFGLKPDVESPLFHLGGYNPPPVDYIGLSRNFKYLEATRGDYTDIGYFPSQTGAALNEVKLAGYHFKANNFYTGMILVTFRNGEPVKWLNITGYVKATNLATVSPSFSPEDHPQEGDYYTIIQEFQYKFETPEQAALTPAPDTDPPLSINSVPADGASGVSLQPTIIVYLKDTGDGIDKNSVALNLSNGAGECGFAATPCNIDNNYSKLKVVFQPSQLEPDTPYTLNIAADDLQGNPLAADINFTTGNAGAENNPPYLDDLSPVDGQTGVSVNSAIQFKLRDNGSGVNPDSLVFRLNGQEKPAEKTAITDGNGVYPDYLVYYKPENKFVPGTNQTVQILAEDYNGNSLAEAIDFTAAADHTPPKDISKLRAEVQPDKTLKLTWIPSENIDCDIADFPYTLYIKRAGHDYNKVWHLVRLYYSDGAYTMTKPGVRLCGFKITVKDIYGNESSGAAVGVEIDTDKDGVMDCLDNCTFKPNANQRDTDGDGYGNLCDPDLNNDCIVDSADMAIFEAAYGSKLGDQNYNPNADFNGNNWVKKGDLTIINMYTGKKPGPGLGICQ